MNYFAGLSFRKLWNLAILRGACLPLLFRHDLFLAHRESLLSQHLLVQSRDS